MEISEKNRGFTLMETIVVLIILSIIGIFIMVFWPGKSIELRAEAEKLAHDIRYVQSLCIARNARYRLVFNSFPAGYLLTDASGNAIFHPANPQSALIQFSSGISYGTITPSSSYLTFTGRGVPYIFTGTLQKLTSVLQVTLADGSVNRLVQVTPDTGYVTVS